MNWLGDWANLLLRWTHFIAGIAWIGSSFYFIWLDRTLTAPAIARPGVEGDLWMVHSGGFYQVEKRRPGPGEVPPVLHWFKWEAMLTWITGISLLVLVYYLSDAYLLDPGTARIGRGTAIALGIALLVFGWLIYDWLWRSPLTRQRGVAGGISPEQVAWLRALPPARGLHLVVSHFVPFQRVKQRPPRFCQTSMNRSRTL